MSMATERVLWPSTVLLVMTNGRDALLLRTLQSFFEKVKGQIDFVFIHDDSGDVYHHEVLVDLLNDVDMPVDHIAMHTTTRSLGFGGAIRNAWGMLVEYRARFPFDWVFHLEDDFIFTQDIDLRNMRGLLIDYPYLAQMALKRQPWGSDAEFPNGFMQAAPSHYTQHEDDDDFWVETRRNWTTNPSLFRADLLNRGWPEDPFSEGKYGFELKENGLPWGIPGEDVQFGILGRIEDSPLVHHIGYYRTGSGY